MTVVAVVCAYNEAPRIEQVLRTLVSATSLSGVVVVDDGSTDGTDVVASRVHGVKVLRSGKNFGKGSSMLSAVRILDRTNVKHVLFCDADLQGLCSSQVDGMVEELHRTNATQVVGVRAHGLGTLSIVGTCGFTDIIGGERVVDMSVLRQVPARYWSGYKIETAINAKVDQLGGVTVLYPLQGVRITSKEEKIGAVPGFLKNVRMFSDIATTKRSLSYGVDAVPNFVDSLKGIGSAFASLTHYTISRGLTWLDP